MTDWKANDLPLLITGDTQSGKTVLASEIHATSDRYSIFLNTEAEPNIRGIDVSSPSEITEAMSKGARRFNYQVDSFSGESELEELRTYLWTLSERTGRRAKTQVVVDESHDIATEGTREGPLHRLCKRGAKRGIKTVMITQDPSSIAKMVARQADYHVWVGRPSPFHESYFRTYRLPFDRLREQQQYEYSVMQGSKIVATGRTKKEYA